MNQNYRIFAVVLSFIVQSSYLYNLEILKHNTGTCHCFQIIDIVFNTETSKYIYNGLVNNALKAFNMISVTDLCSVSQEGEFWLTLFWV